MYGYIYGRIFVYFTGDFRVLGQGRDYREGMELGFDSSCRFGFGFGICWDLYNKVFLFYDLEC